MTSTDTASLVSLVFATSRLIHERLRNTGQIKPFTFLRLKTLGYVAANPRSPMRNIAEYLNITPPSATSLVNNLVREGYIERILDKKDRRLIRLAITLKGKKSLKNGTRQMTSKMKDVLSHLNREERKNLTKIMTKLSQIYNT